MTKMFFDSIIMLRFCETKVSKKEFYGEKKRNIDINNMVI